MIPPPPHELVYLNISEFFITHAHQQPKKEENPGGYEWILEQFPRHMFVSESDYIGLLESLENLIKELAIQPSSPTYNNNSNDPSSMNHNNQLYLHHSQQQQQQPQQQHHHNHFDDNSYMKSNLTTVFSPIGKSDNHKHNISPSFQQTLYLQKEAPQLPHHNHPNQQLQAPQSHFDIYDFQRDLRVTSLNRIFSIFIINMSNRLTSLGFTETLVFLVLLRKSLNEIGDQFCASPLNQQISSIYPIGQTHQDSQIQQCNQQYSNILQEGQQQYQQLFQSQLNQNDLTTHDCIEENITTIAQNQEPKKSEEINHSSESDLKKKSLEHENNTTKNIEVMHSKQPKSEVSSASKPLRRSKRIFLKTDPIESQQLSNNHPDEKGSILVSRETNHIDSEHICSATISTATAINSLATADTSSSMINPTASTAGSVITSSNLEGQHAHTPKAILSSSSATTATITTTTTTTDGTTTTGVNSTGFSYEITAAQPPIDFCSDHSGERIGEIANEFISVLLPAYFETAINPSELDSLSVFTRSEEGIKNTCIFFRLFVEWMYVYKFSAASLSFTSAPEQKPIDIIITTEPETNHLKNNSNQQLNNHQSQESHQPPSSKEPTKQNIKTALNFSNHLEIEEYLNNSSRDNNLDLKFNRGSNTNRLVNHLVDFEDNLLPSSGAITATAVPSGAIGAHQIQGMYQQHPYADDDPDYRMYNRNVYMPAFSQYAAAAAVAASASAAAAAAAQSSSSSFFPSTPSQSTFPQLSSSMISQNPLQQQFMTNYQFNRMHSNLQQPSYQDFYHNQQTNNSMVFPYNQNQQQQQQQQLNSAYFQVSTPSASAQQQANWTHTAMYSQQPYYYSNTIHPQQQYSIQSGRAVSSVKHNSTTPMNVPNIPFLSELVEQFP